MLEDEEKFNQANASYTVNASYGVNELLDGPVMTGPSTSNNRITDTSLIKWYRMSIADLARDCKARAEKGGKYKKNTAYSTK